MKKITEGPYKGQYEGEHGVIYSEEIARMKFPHEFKSPPKKKAASKKRSK